MLLQRGVHPAQDVLGMFQPIFPGGCQNHRARPVAFDQLCIERLFQFRQLLRDRRL